MSSINSPVKELRSLWIDKFPEKKVIYPEKIVFYDGVLICRAKNTYHLYSNRIKSHVHYSDGRFPDHNSMMVALQRMGVITKEQLKEHNTWVEERSKRSSKRYALERMEELAKEFGFKLTEAQRKALFVEDDKRIVED